ncbi:unnamed protein product [Ceratitis capitata]|uniref:(Mediterranean fruit fly) hypothetical protein n=1 Tax=Ceratitis capitata TaxID=7213 RepID=A0A811UYP0_CERCA|nr:unnamed protein product [Ceratitis capitata]
MKARIYALSSLVMCSAMERVQCKYNVSFWESLYRRERPHLSRVLPFSIWYLPVVETLPTLFWTEVREHFLELLHLMRLLNDNIAPLILLACSNNMYFICFQLFNSFQNIGVDLIAVFAFWYSLFFAIFRTILTLLTASSVNDYSKKILLTLRSVPSTSWCTEMASTIFTYEVMVTDVINKGAIQQVTNYCRPIEYDTQSE